MIKIGRNVCSDPQACTDLEWLVTNGIGGYAAGTVSGALTRRYHGLLVAALQPPAGRTNLVSKIDDAIIYDESRYELSNNWWGGHQAGISGEGHKQINSFHLDGSMPVWRYCAGDAQIEKRIWMAYHQNTTYIRYTYTHGILPATLEGKILVNCKDFHANTQAGDWEMQVSQIDGGVQIDSFFGAAPFYLLSGDGQITPTHDWYRNYFLSREAYRGLDAVGDHLLAAQFLQTLSPGESFTLVCSTDEQVLNQVWSVEDIYKQTLARDRGLVKQAELDEEPAWIQQLALATDQFVVERKAGDNPNGRSVIAGYHWFADWGRDTMISLPGLLLSTRRYPEAALVLRTFANYVDQGMLPNRFPDAGEVPEYNTVDATLWYFEAIRAYFAETADLELIEELYPILKEIIGWHARGTRYSIHIDPQDHLLHSGEEGVQLTWMDAKVGDWVVTPRSGKAVEINALWYNALRSMADFAAAINQPEDILIFNEKGDQVQKSFERFWIKEGGYCYDVIDTPDVNDASLRPNQLFAISLHHSPLSEDQQRSIVNRCARYLYTPHGIRSLARFEPEYVGTYSGDSLKRDGSYHQGTVWGWLLGPFVEAHYRVYQDRDAARAFLRPMEHHLCQQAVGSIAEIFDGDPPFLPRGCVAQAWSVAEVLRVWILTGSK